MEPLPAPHRFVGIDLHKQSVTIAAVDAQQQIVLRPLRLSLVEFTAWAPQHLVQTDVVVIEATTNAWWFVDLVQPLVAQVLVANPRLLQLITTARVKTDARDALKLAKLLAAGLIPSVWIPPIHVRELRGLLSHRTRLVGQRTQARNRLHAVLHRHQIVPPAGALFGAKQRSWWETLSLSTSEQLRVQQDLMLHDTLETLIATVDTAIAEQSASPQWMTPARQLVQLPGIGVLTAMTILAAIGDWTRFPCAKHLVGYAGLGARVHASGDTQRTGRITKEGRRDLRRVLVEAAWIAVGSTGHWKDVFTRLSQRMPPQKAIVAIARKLLVVVWHVLTKPVVDQHGDPALIASALMTWATKHRLARRMGVSRGAFVRRQLDGLGIGTDLTTVRYGGQQAPLPPVGHHHDPPYRSYVRHVVVDSE